MQIKKHDFYGKTACLGQASRLSTRVSRTFPSVSVGKVGELRVRFGRGRGRVLDYVEGSNFGVVTASNSQDRKRRPTEIFAIISAATTTVPFTYAMSTHVISSQVVIRVQSSLCNVDWNAQRTQRTVMTISLPCAGQDVRREETNV